MKLPQSEWLDKMNPTFKAFPEIANKDSEFITIIADGYRFGAYHDRLRIIAKWFAEMEKKKGS